MATFSTHILNSLNGTHFSDIDVKLFRCTKTDKNELIFHKNDATYHIPLIISPYGMSCWISR